jgi:hypothetical protein
VDAIVIAVVSAGGGVLVAVLGPLVGGWVRRSRNGAVNEAQERMQFTRDLRVRVDKLEADLLEERRVSALHTTAIAELSALIHAHLQGHPQLESLLRVLVKHEERTRRSG